MRARDANVGAGSAFDPSFHDGGGYLQRHSAYADSQDECAIASRFTANGCDLTSLPAGFVCSHDNLHDVAAMGMRSVVVGCTSDGAGEPDLRGTSSVHLHFAASFGGAYLIGEAQTGSNDQFGTPYGNWQ